MSIILILLLSGLASGQEPYVLYEGDVILVEHQCEKGNWIGPLRTDEGKVLLLDKNLLHILPTGSEERKMLPWDCMQNWWVGEEHYSRDGGMILLLASTGAGLGLLAGYQVSKNTDYSGHSFGGGIGREIGTIAGYSAGGALIGVLIGLEIAKPILKYTWLPVNNDQIIVEPKVSEGAVGVGLTFVF